VPRGRIEARRGGRRWGPRCAQPAAWSEAVEVAGCTQRSQRLGDLLPGFANPFQRQAIEAAEAGRLGIFRRGRSGRLGCFEARRDGRRWGHKGALAGIPLAMKAAVAVTDMGVIDMLQDRHS
jgi:hypothetical protein